MDAFGHVNNAVYLNYLEEARDRLLTELFEGADDFVIARVAVDYRREVTQADRAVVVTCRVEGWGRSSVTTAETMTLGDGTVVAEAVTVLVARDPLAGGSRPLTGPERDRLTARWS